jgi:O-antigen/teichoic acid export membrane protein
MVISSFARLGVSQTIQPILGRLLTTGDLHAAEQTYRTGSAWLVAPTWPLFLTAAIFAVPLLRLRTGVRDRRHRPHDPERRLAGRIGCGPVDNALLMAGKSGWTSINTGIGLVLNIGLNLWLIPRYGINGAAAAWSASLVWMNVAPLVQVHASLRISPFGPAWPLAAAGGGLVFGGTLALARALVGESAAGLAVGLVVAGPVYGAYLWAVRRPCTSGASRRASAGAPAAA